MDENKGMVLDLVPDGDFEHQEIEAATYLLLPGG
jgi:hypothetical protein